jgi:hypothetical protein
LRALQEFLDTKHFGAAFTGVVAMATSYVAGAMGLSLIILPLLVVALYQLCFSAAPTNSLKDVLRPPSRRPSPNGLRADRVWIATKHPVEASPGL